MFQKIIKRLLSLGIIFVCLGKSVTTVQANPTASTHMQTNATIRTGAWVDELVFSVNSEAANAISQIQANQLDVYAYSVSDSNLYKTVQSDPNLDSSLSYGSYNEITVNPAGLTFNDGRLNPFYQYKIREALNWLIDRNYIVQNIYGGMAFARFVPLSFAFPDYERYSTTIKSLETTYAYDLTKANSTIQAAMTNLGATLSGGKWQYHGQPVTIIIIIRIEDQRKAIGDYLANQLEKVGFTVDRQYKTRSEASPIWNQSNPADGLWHLYTGSWITTAISRDDGTNFGYFYTPRGSGSPLWQSYTPTPFFWNVAQQLWDNNFSNMNERDNLFNLALGYALNDTGSGSVRIWLVDQQLFSPYRSNVMIASDLAGGIAGSQSWPYTARFTGLEGGTLRIAQPGLLVEPWNPVGGSNWIYDQMPIRATQDAGLMTDPYDGLNWPLRIASAEVVVETGLPVQKTRDYVTLNFASTITMPDDTWVDWDATQQRFITAAEKYGSPQTAKIKSTVVYPQDLFTTVQWHDGSPLDVSDFVMAMILTFDRAKPASAIYDDSAVATYEWFMSHFKGVRIVSTNPLTIESYDDQYYLDAENCVRSWWPNYDYGPGAWHNLALGIQADAAHTLAFSVDKANQLAIDWMDFTRGNSLNILKYYLDSSALSNYIPYFNTLSAYITSTEAQARWARLQNWYTIHHNYWLGTGPFYLDTVSPNLRLKRFAQYPDQAGRWDFMAVDPILGVNYIEGAPGSSFTFSGSGYAPDSTIYILANNQQIGTTKSDADGNISVLLSTSPAGGGLQIASSTEEGYYMITAKRFLTAPLAPTELVWIVIDDSAPVRPVEGSGTVIAVPDGLAYTQRLYLPIGQR